MLAETKSCGSFRLLARTPAKTEETGENRRSYYRIVKYAMSKTQAS